MSNPADQLNIRGVTRPLLCSLAPPDSHALQRTEMLTEVDFKWLMAGQGRWIDSHKLRIDSAYAQDCLVLALNSKCEPLRRCAQLLQNEFQAKCRPVLCAA
jgi:hypothetical protein